MTAAWSVPPPRRLPDLRRQLERSLGTEAGLVASAGCIERGLGSIIPQGPAWEGAAVLNWQEAARLREAALYYVTPEMTALACAAASTPPLAPVELGRAPAPGGLMVFGQPLAAYDVDGTTWTTSIHAVSWGPWTPFLSGPDGQRPERWLFRGVAGQPTPDGGYERKQGVFSSDGWEGRPCLWVTFWGRNRGHETAKEMMARAGTHLPDLNWDNESLMFDNAQLQAFGEDPDNHGGWLTVLYTCWQLMGQAARTGRTPLTDTTVVRAAPTDARRARRQGYRHADVHVVDLGRVVAGQMRDTEAVPAAHRPREYQCRWPVRPHRRSHCMNPRAHADGDCRHEEIIVPFQVRGPADKPLKTADTVTVWSQLR